MTKLKHCAGAGSFLYLFIITICYISTLYGDVRVEPGATYSAGYSGAVLMRAYNTTSLVYQLAGFRFFTPGHQWPGIDVTITTNPQGGQMFHEARVKLSEKMELVPNGVNVSQSYYFMWDIQNLANDGTMTGEYVLLKTGSQGIPIDPQDEDPITVDQIDSLILLPNFYNPDYRYLDSLGTHGGTYSGGLLDTYWGETQIQMAIPKTNFSVNQTSINLDPSETGGPLYWMGLAMGQEYFNIDKQLLIATGFKESGIAANGLPYISQNAGGVYGAFHVENWTLLARAIAWPHFYPDDQTELVASPNATVFANLYKPVGTFCGEYMGATVTPENSGFIVNSVVISGLNYWYLYYLLGYSEDYCWKETLEFCIDPYIGVAALIPLYNLGMNSGSEAPLHVNNYQTLLNDPLARNQFAPGNSNYRDDIIRGIEALVGASQQALTDPSVVLWDDFITLDDIKTFFFGQGGTVTSQGQGGLLKQFDIDRQAMWNDVQAAFNKLAPHWNQTPAAISWRYDFLTLLRVVKGMFDVMRPRPADDESRVWIDNRSLVGGCSIENDNAYPFINFGTGVMNGNDYELDVNVTDNLDVGEVQWTTDYDWGWFLPANYLNGGATNKNFKVIVANATLGADLWVWATDSSGNTIVKKTRVSGGPDWPELDSTIIEDTRGNGVGDRITIHIRPGVGNDPDSLSEYQNLQYSWPTQTNMINATNNVTVNADNLQISDNTLTGGAGLGKVTFDYPSKPGYEDAVLDRIGPAFEWDGATYNIPDVGGSPDTLHATLTEPIKQNLDTNTAYVNFKTAAGTPVATVSTRAIHVSGGIQWQFVFPTGTVAQYDSVNLVPTSGLTDTVGAGNTPLVNNWFVPIEKIGNVEPQWVKGYIKDTVGDGMGNEITITIQEGTSDTAYDLNDCSQIRYSWPQKNNFTNALITDPNVSVSRSDLLIYDNTSSGVGEGNGELDFPESITIKGDIIDSVGPAIVQAVLLEKELTNDLDSLYITFTEPVTENLLNNHQYLKVNGTPVNSLTAIKQDAQSLLWLFVLNANTVHENDRVNLVHNSGLIDQAFPNDNAHNPPLPNNQEVTVILLTSTYKVVDGKYLDTDAEGTMDSIMARALPCLTR
jgi:hypothetical protein